MSTITRLLTTTATTTTTTTTIYSLFFQIEFAS